MKISEEYQLWMISFAEDGESQSKFIGFFDSDWQAELEGERHSGEAKIVRVDVIVSTKRS